MNKEIYDRMVNRDIELDKTNDYITYDLKDYSTSNDTSTGSIIMTWFIFLLFVSCIFLVFDVNLFPITIIIFIIIAVYCVLNADPNEIKMDNNMKNEVNSMYQRLKKHNDIAISNYIHKIFDENNMKNLDKRVVIKPHEEIVIDNNLKMLLYYHLSATASWGIELKKLVTTGFNDILKYEVLNKTTSKQIATSKTSSNSGKALGGAVASHLLAGNATAGAVIGGSGARTTETTYKTITNEKYEIVIYLNSLNTSTLTINTTSNDVLKEVTATLEYIINNKI